MSVTFGVLVDETQSRIEAVAANGEFYWPDMLSVQAHWAMEELQVTHADIIAILAARPGMLANVVPLRDPTKSAVSLYEIALEALNIEIVKNIDMAPFGHLAARWIRELRPSIIPSYLRDEMERAAILQGAVPAHQ